MSELIARGRIYPFSFLEPQIDFGLVRDVDISSSIFEIETFDNMNSINLFCSKNLPFAKVFGGFMFVCLASSADGQWPLQNKPGPTGFPGQDVSTYPKSETGAQEPRKKDLPPKPAFRKLSEVEYELSGGWKLRSVLEVAGTIHELSLPGFDDSAWHQATVPGTVLTTLVDQGVYPEPTFGLNNLAIPEELCHQDWWYRLEFKLEPGMVGKEFSLCFNGINYAAEVWLNGQPLGDIKGAFMRGKFDVSGLVRLGGANALAVRISPPPHPGVPHEESLVAGAGQANGGSLTSDGPTFFCTEGWDWIPGIRDRCSGIWQSVVLKSGGPVTLDDSQVTTTLPLPDISRATVFLSAQISNRSRSENSVLVRAEFSGKRIESRVDLVALETRRVEFRKEDYPDLEMENPKLWWPNGYGDPSLYDLKLSVFTKDGILSDIKRERFGVRQVTYELSALDSVMNAVVPIELDPSSTEGERLVDVRHPALRKLETGIWVPTLVEDFKKSPGGKVVEEPTSAPFLMIKVNGVPIICKGGNWGLDEALKRSSRERLEPFFRLQRDANFTMVRNWCGQSTEEVFFELADEYGLMVWSDFWISTQDWNQEPLDLRLFLRNAEDVIKRFRNHPSIVIWCGRNEGVPPPVLNEGLDDLVRKYDGTRYYQPNSRDVSLLPSGPWEYEGLKNFFNNHGLGFTTEVGLPCPPSADSFRAMMAPEDLWPISDAWAYHDWHQAHHGVVKPFMDALEASYGAAVDFEDFCRKAQMLTYVSHRAMFEGLNARLWKPATGRLMWMSHPAWPSMNWQMYSSDYDTNGAYFGVQKACEPLHVQYNLDDGAVVVANTTLEDKRASQVKVELYDFESKLVERIEVTVDAIANSSCEALTLFEGGYSGAQLNFLKLELGDSEGALLSDNFYWLTKQDEDLQILNTLRKVELSGTARLVAPGRIELQIENPTETVALLVKPTLRDQSGMRILPAFVDDGDFSLLPREHRRVFIEFPTDTSGKRFDVILEGWNLESVSLAVAKGPLIDNW